MFIHSCMCMISEFDQCLFVGRISEPTHVHLERILLKSLQPFTKVAKAVNPTMARLSFHTDPTTMLTAMIKHL